MNTNIDNITGCGMSLLVNNTCQTYGSNWHAQPAGAITTNNSDAQLSDWFCCPEGATTVEAGCFGTDLSGDTGE